MEAKGLAGTEASTVGRRDKPRHGSMETESDAIMGKQEVTVSGTLHMYHGAVHVGSLCKELKPRIRHIEEWGKRFLVFS